MKKRNTLFPVPWESETIPHFVEPVEYEENSL